MENHGSRDVCAAAIKIALTNNREEEENLKKAFKDIEVLTAAVDYGGEFLLSVMKIVERAVVAAKRECIIAGHHNEEGAVAGAAHEAIAQVSQKAIGLNIGGKIGIARYHDHVAVAIFVGIGLLHLNEIALGLGHRVI